jgi:hypothetical protein
MMLLAETAIDVPFVAVVAAVIGATVGPVVA